MRVSNAMILLMDLLCSKDSDFFLDKHFPL